MTDTSRSGDLVERLRSVDVSWSETGEWCAEAADRIEALEAENERLRDDSWFDQFEEQEQLRDNAEQRLSVVEAENERLREELAEAYIKLSGKSIHASDCATSNAPAKEPGPCNCDAPGDADLVGRLRGDWPEILVEKHWMMDSDAIDKQRAEAADRIEALVAKIERLRFHLDTALEALIMEGVCDGECGACKEARAALGEKQ